MGTLFAFAFTTYALRVIRHHLLLDIVAAGLMLGAILYVSPAMFVLTFAAYLVFLLANYLPKRVEKGIPQIQPTAFAHLGRWLGVPLVAFLGTAPWTLTHLPELQGLWQDWIQHLTLPGAWDYDLLVFRQGIWILPFVVFGIVAGSWRYRSVILWGIGWIVLALLLHPYVDKSPSLPVALNFGLTEDKAQGLIPIVPYVLLGGFGLLWLYERVNKAIHDAYRQSFYVIMGLVLGGIFVLFGYMGLGAFPTLYDGSAIHYALNAQGDFAAMVWLRDHTPEDSFILNSPSDVWTAPTSGRDAIYIASPEGAAVDKARFAGYPPLVNLSLEPNMADEYLIQYGVDYIIVPQDSSSKRYVGADELRDLPFLALVFEQDGAAVYRVLQDE
jgi:hypothetical protein